MAEIIITSFFTNGGNPITTLSPTIRIWEVEAGDQTLLIGAPEGTNDPGPAGGGSVPGAGTGTNGIMIPMFDNTIGTAGSGATQGGSEDGFYKYTFDAVNGYDPEKCYLFRVDGGSTQPAGERYQVGEFDKSDNVDALVDAIYDEPRLDHQLAGSVGEAINQDRANLTQMVLDLSDVEALVSLLLKFETGRTKIDGINSTLIVYDDDCITPLRTFQLKDSNGAPSTAEVCERLPLAAGTTDGLGTCV
jgi:hypothetical protein